MRIAGTEINLGQRALEIYLSGCREPHCPGCHNPELWDFSVGYPWERFWPGLRKKILELGANNLIDMIWVLGGEPLHQDGCALLTFLAELRATGLKIMLWTREEGIPEEVRPFLDYVKFGAYRENEPSWREPLLGIELANRGQYVMEVKNGR